MDISTLANYADIVGACTIVTGVLFGLYQIRLNRRQQRNTIASQLTQTFLSADLANAFSLLRGLPDGVSPEILRAQDAEMERAAVTVTTSFETMGLLVYRDFAELDLVMDMAGGMMGVMWRKLHIWQVAMRVEQGQPSWAEWFEWLALQSYERKGTEPLNPDAGVAARAIVPEQASVTPLQQHSGAKQLKAAR
jgi:hypothetical protein